MAFVGTKQELEKLMKEVLPKYLYEESYLLEIEDMDEKQQRNVLEAMAKCIDLGYVENLKYIRSIDGHVASLFHFVRDLQNSSNTVKDSHPVCITKAGESFLSK